MHANLDRRLRAVANFVKQGARIADIGTDHARVPLALLEAGRVSFAVAVDKNRGPYEAALRAAQATSVGERLSIRLGDGLSPLLPAEVDTLILAGMGGTLCIAILEAGKEVLQAARHVILQPMTDVPEMRRWLYMHGWHLEDEALAKADGKLYVILSAVQGTQPLPSPLQLEIGPCLWNQRPPLFMNHVEKIFHAWQKAAQGMEQSTRMRGSEAHQNILAKLQTLQEVYK